MPLDLPSPVAAPTADLDSKERLKADLIKVGLRVQSAEGLTDNARKPIEVDWRVWADCTEDVRKAVEVALIHEIGVVLLASGTSATNEFTINKLLPTAQLRGAIAISLGRNQNVKLSDLEVNERGDVMIDDITYKVFEYPRNWIRIFESPDLNQAPHLVNLWGSVIPDDLNRQLRDHFRMVDIEEDGEVHRCVPTTNIDITTFQQAESAAVTVTGGQGASRTNVEWILYEAINVDKNAQIRRLRGKQAKMQVGLCGAAGGITELTFEVLFDHPHEFAFMIPLQGDLEKAFTERIPRLQAVLHKHTQMIRTPKGRLISQTGKPLLFKGLELIFQPSMAKTVQRLNGNAASQIAQGISSAMLEHGAIMGIMINGTTSLDQAEIIAELFEVLGLDDNNANTKLGITPMEEPYYQPSQMPNVRLARETIASKARENGIEGHSVSTDINIIFRATDPVKIYELSVIVGRAYFNYIQDLFDMGAEVDIYGHALLGNKCSKGGWDPHCRATLIRQSDESDEDYAARCKKLDDRKTKFTAELCAIVEEYSEFLEMPPGEKSLFSNPAYFRNLKKKKPNEFEAYVSYIDELGGDTFGFKKKGILAKA